MKKIKDIKRDNSVAGEDHLSDYMLRLMREDKNEEQEKNKEE